MKPELIAISLFKSLHRLVYADIYDDRTAIARLERLRPMIDGRSIAIVGNAKSLFSGNHGPEIDGHDVILRLNFGAVSAPQQQGTRTDLLGTSCRISAAEIDRLFEAPQIIWLTARREKMPGDLLARRRELAVVPILLYQQLLGQMQDARPSSGLIATYLITRFFSPAKVTLFGFDWKATVTFYHEARTRHRNAPPRLDGWAQEAKLIRGWAETDARLRIVMS